MRPGRSRQHSDGDRSGDGPFWAALAPIRTCTIQASGAKLGCLTAMVTGSGSRLRPRANAAAKPAGKRCGRHDDATQRAWLQRQGELLGCTWASPAAKFASPSGHRWKTRWVTATRCCCPAAQLMPSRTLQCWTSDQDCPRPGLPGVPNQKPPPCGIRLTKGLLSDCRRR